MPVRGIGLGLWRTPRRTAGASVNIVAPVVTGTGYVGYTLTCTTGAWTGSPFPAITYQWQRSGVDIALATASTYVMTLADEGLPIRCVVTATNAFGATAANSNAIEQWVPTDLGAALWGWFDAEDSTTITIATGISQWNDKSAALDHLSQATGARQPAYQAAAWTGGRPAVEYVAGGKGLFSTVAKVRLRNTNGGVVAMSTKRDTLANVTMNYFNLKNSGNAAFLAPRTVGATQTFQIRTRRVAADAISTTTLTEVETTDAGVLVATNDYSAGQCRMRKNGTAGVLTANGASTGLFENLDTTGSFLGYEDSGGAITNQFVGLIHEAVMIAGNQTDAVLEKLEAYLAWRGRTNAALAGAHPWFASAPTP